MPRIIGIDLFSGAGGMTLGAKNAGIDIKLAVELDPHAAATYKLNHPEVSVHNNDIRLLQEIPVQREEGDVSVLFGGPPCQGFSTSNQRTRNAENTGNYLYQEFVRVTDIWEPDWVVFENVRGITETENGAFLEQTINDLTGLGYTCEHQILNAADFGVPQRRSRLFVVASRHRIDFNFPTGARVGNPLPVRDALDDLKDLENGARQDMLPYNADVAPSEYALQLRTDARLISGHLVSRNADFVLERYPHIPQGGNWENIPEHLMTNYADRSRCHTGIYHRLNLDTPSVVIGNYRKNMLIHPTQHRGLSVREAARIQSFPDWYRFAGTIGFQQQQVGNAVPPLLAQAVFASINQLCM